MIKKIENCIYCSQKMESVTAKKKFCSDRCRVYWNRMKKGNETINTDLDLKPLIEKKSFTPQNSNVSAIKKLIKKEEDIDEKIKRWTKKKLSIDEIRAMCPSDLTGFERAKWISDKREEEGV